MSDPISEDLDRQIAMTHARFTESMQARLPEMSPETKERYFAVLSLLVEKLSDVDAPLRDVMREMIAEATGFFVQELGT